MTRCLMGFYIQFSSYNYQNQICHFIGTPLTLKFTVSDVWWGKKSKVPLMDCTLGLNLTFWEFKLYCDQVWSGSKKGSRNSKKLRNIKGGNNAVWEAIKTVQIKMHCGDNVSNLVFFSINNSGIGGIGLILWFYFSGWCGCSPISESGDDNRFIRREEQLDTGHASLCLSKSQNLYFD